MEEEPQLHVESASEFGDWLAAHHDTMTGVWLVTWRSVTERAAPDYEDAVMEALRYGWIDSTKRVLDDERHMQRFSPRRAGSGWSRSNKDRIATLEEQGRLEPAGRAMVDAARADGSWELLDSVEALEVPDDLAAALDSVPGAREHFEGFPPSARKAILAWIVMAKRPSTRERRVTDAAHKAARGERAQG